MTTYNILFFGGLKAFFPSETAVTLADNATAQNLIDTLTAQQPAAKNLLDACVVAVDKKVVAKTDLIVGRAKIALLPPFSGG